MAGDLFLKEKIKAKRKEEFSKKYQSLRVSEFLL